MNLIRYVKWRWWRSLNWLEIERYNFQSPIPNLILLHRILERIDLDTFVYLIQSGGKLKEFPAFYMNVETLTIDLHRRCNQIQYKTTLGHESLNPSIKLIREFFIGENRRYVPYREGYDALRTNTLVLIELLNQELQASNGEALDNHYFRRSAKMLLTVERLLVTISQ